jgi:hypothetical protein
MGRPLNKKYFGNRNIGTTGTADDKIGGEGIASIALGAANNSSGYTAGTSQISIATPTLPGGVRAVGSLVVGPAGALLTIAAGTSGTNVTTFTGSGTFAGVAGTTYTATQKATSGSGSGATFTVTVSSGTSYASNTTITCTSKGTGYAVSDTVTLAGNLLGGANTTNDIVITLGGAVAAAGTITGITITEKGSGYTTVPTVTLSTGTQGTLTVTAVRTLDTGNVGSTTNQENAIIMTAFLTGGSATTVDIIKQVSTNRFKVTDGTRTGIVKLKSSVATAAGEGSIKFTDNAGTPGTYFATKITGRKATVTRGTGTAFATGAQVKWNMTAATADSLLVENA